jgi:hypothetical protein
MAGEWIEDAKRIAVAGYRQVLEDGRDVCDSESDAEYSDHGNTLEGTRVATLASARLTTEHARSAAQLNQIPSQILNSLQIDCARILLIH